MVNESRSHVVGPSPDGVSSVLRPWEIGELPAAPVITSRSWLALLGPGVLLAGSSVGSGEWLLGPAVSAQYGPTLLWLATTSILAQVFFNIEVMRYTLYCGEPIHVGYLRTRPHAALWVVVYLLLDFGSLWPMNAGAAAIPLAAAFLGHLPGDSIIDILGWSVHEREFVRYLSMVLFVLAFIPLIFGGAVYRMLERLMAAKLVVVLSFLIFVCLFMVSWQHWGETVRGLVSFGKAPLRPDTLVVGRHFLVSQRDGATTYRVRGSMEDGQTKVVGFAVTQGKRTENFESIDKIPDARRAELLPVRQTLAERAAALYSPHGFYVQIDRHDTAITLRGTLRENGSWDFTQAEIQPRNQPAAHYSQLTDIPEPYAKRVRNILQNLGNEDIHLLAYAVAHREIPPLDWRVLAAFAAFAGAGGLTNTLFSNYARDKGWGMGKHVGAIPSAVGGTTIALSHVGMVFEPTQSALERWRGWMRWIIRDQLGIWMLCSLIGMALPCMLSLEFVRHAPISDNRVSAMMAEGMAHHYPNYADFWWFTTLLVGFVIIYPGQVLAGDALARRWTDITWTSSRTLQQLPKNRVKYVYYGIMTAYGVWGLFVLNNTTPLLVVQISGILGNLALGVAALHTLAVNRTLLPREIRPRLGSQIGLVFCAIFFLSITAVVVWYSW